MYPKGFLTLVLHGGDWSNLYPFKFVSGENLSKTEEVSVPAWIELPLSGFPLSVFFHLCFLNISINKATLEIDKRVNVWDISTKKKKVKIRQKSEGIKKLPSFIVSFQRTEVS